MDHATLENDAPLPLSRHFRSPSKQPNPLLLAPVQIPQYYALSPPEQLTITPGKLDMMNDYLEQASTHANADVVWSFSSMICANRGEYAWSGVHVNDDVARRRADVLLNLRCNGGAASKGCPFNRTCCSNYKQSTVAQWVILLIAMFMLPGLLLFRRKHVLRYLPAAEVCNALAIFALIVCFCFYTDRTQVFEKAQKQFNRREFFAAWMAVAAVGVLSVRESEPSAAPHAISEERDNEEDLRPGQSDEWKGWVLAFILIYHYTNASDTLWIYKLARIMVASYLFIDGYDHTLYLLRKGDYSLKRATTVLLRLNLLSCTLPYMIGSEYTFYYLPFMLSFWFLVNYFTLKIGAAYDLDFNILLGKIILSATLTTVFTMMPGILEFAALLLRYSCAISWSVTEWRSSISLDLYITYVGMITAILRHRRSLLSSGSPPPSHPIDSVLRYTKSKSHLFKPAAALTSIIFLLAFWVPSGHLSNPKDYNMWHPYISCIPILSFRVIRNSHPNLRNYHSTAFAWLGRCSHEAYVLHYHI